MLGRFVSLLLLLLPHALPPATAGELHDSLAGLSEVCQFVYEGKEKMADAAERETYEYEEFMTEWLVDVPDGRDIADEIAERLGFINFGPISQDGGTVYRFAVKEEEAMLVPFYEPDVQKTGELTAEEGVASAKQEIVDVLCSEIADQGVRQKRQVTGPRSLRVEYTTANSGIVRWSHPTSGAPNSYELIYAAIIISSGSVSGRIAILRLPASPTSRTVTPLDRDDINIFFLTAVYADAVSSTLHLRGGATLPAPTNLQVSTVNSRTIRVSWGPPPRFGTYTYAIVLFNVTNILWYNINSATSQDITDLEHLSTYLVIVVAISGEAYSAATLIHTLEVVRCPLLNIVSGSVRLTGFTPGSTATYSCNDGYNLVGTSVRTCQANGEWSGSAPICVPVLCPSLTVEDGNVTVVTGLTPGSTATYTCDTGFELVGTGFRTCLASGVWSGTDPVCNEGPPRNIAIVQQLPASCIISWVQPESGPPTTNYIVTYIFLANSSTAVCKEKRRLTVAADNTTVVLDDVDLSPGSVHVVIVTAVSEDVSVSDIQYVAISSFVTPALPAAQWVSQTSAILSWPSNNLCRQYLVIYISLDGKEGIIVTNGTTAELTDLKEETYVAVLICISVSGEYVENLYAPVKMTQPTILLE